MSTRFKHVLDGDRFGINYRFDLVDDGLPRHKHEDWDSHTVEVHEGAVMIVYCGGAQWDALLPGTHRIAWDLQHQIIALHDKTEITNWWVNGQPEHYKNLPPEELEGSFDVHTFRKTT